MKLVITLRKTSDNSFNRKFEFTQFPVKLGREADNDIVLEDQRKVVSRNHAKIIDADGLTQIVDLGSANFTYLNGNKLFPNDENALKTGDLIKIGDYELDVVLEQIMVESAPQWDDQKTMIFSNPFVDEVQKISDSILKLSEKYFYDESPLKGEMLRMSIMQGLDGLLSNDVNKVLSEYFASKFLDQNLSSPGKTEPSPKILSEEKPQIKSNTQTSHPTQSAKPQIDYSFSSYFSESVDILLDTVTKLIQGYLQFRQEFFGVTIYQTIPTGSLKDIKEYLFNPDLSAEEQKKRISLIKEETQKLLTHQIGILEGYRTSATEGSQSLLQSLDPEIIERETLSKQTSAMDNLIPNAKKVKILEAIKANYKKYISDPYHLEKKYFRPPFIKGYQKRISAKNEVNEY
ncbi:MAG: FHA domain-containing protein [Ignavibacteriota bacterium]|nr:FHA domain-containing protein [Ignavibacteriota bacterium]MCO6448658.1 FHA domain-containing protein [Ignavibacterium album]QKJ98500.1 MAG: FHA domain-containing protein [Ignavibacteriota bacterium]HOJ07942.1 FHA domain-containing protein [Ignavibacteriaceae bacterium]